MATTIKALREKLDSGLITKQEIIGQKVRIGFLTCEVVNYEKIKDGLPNIWTLKRDDKYYQFIPHNGLTAIDKPKQDIDKDWPFKQTTKTLQKHMTREQAKIINLINSHFPTRLHRNILAIDMTDLCNVHGIKYLIIKTPKKSYIKENHYNIWHILTGTQRKVTATKISGTGFNQKLYIDIC